jgi:hypothetical protein
MRVVKSFRVIAGSVLPFLPQLAGAQGSGGSEKVAIISVFGFGSLMVVGIVAVSLLAPYFSQRRQARLIEVFVEKGREIPPELLAKPAAPQAVVLTPDQLRARSMRRGVVLFALAIGVAVVAYAGTGDVRAVAWGVLLLCLALASFVNARYFSGS